MSVSFDVTFFCLMVGNVNRGVVDIVWCSILLLRGVKCKQRAVMSVSLMWHSFVTDVNDSSSVSFDVTFFCCKRFDEMFKGVKCKQSDVVGIVWCSILLLKGVKCKQRAVMSVSFDVAFFCYRCEWLVGFVWCNIILLKGCEM